VVALVLTVAAVGSGVTVAGAEPRPEPAFRTKAAPRLPKCPGIPVARCGSITVPVDRAHPGGPTIPIVFELYEHRDTTRPALEPIVAVEGGPGYASRGTRDYFLDLFDPLMDRRDLLIVDNRGTGDSQAIDCPALQSYVGDQVENVGACGQQLAGTSDDYGTGNAVEDMVAVLDHLGIAKINLYGDSYGTFFGQTFAVRHPERLRTVTMDGAYPIEGGDPWYRDSARAMRKAFRLACSRAPMCAARGGDPIARMSTMATRLRQAPIVGTAADADGVPRTVTVDAAALSYIAWAASGSATIYRELDAAIRAALKPNPDRVPLLRLAAENLWVGDAGDPVEFSEGLYAAVICHDYPQLWDPKSPIASRRAQYDASVARLAQDDPPAFSPFTDAEWISQPFNEFDYCLKWPVPSVDDPPKVAGTPFPRVPTLVVTSDLDSNTSAEGARKVAQQFGGTLVENVNYTHVSALGDFSRCASDIVVRFVQTRSPGDTSCSRKYAENRLVDTFARRVADMPGSTDDRKVARATAATAADVVARWWSMLGYDGVGLRGGTFTTAGDTKVRFRLQQVRWVEDLTVQGLVTWQRDTGDIQASLVAKRSNGTVARLTLGWNDWEPHATALVIGKVDRRPLTATFPAP
jgi:pimeloyl-ACP methyl ester carboxylesterase